MKLSELFTELKIEGFGQYIADMERAKRAGQDFTQTWVNSQLRAGEAVKANIEALRRVTAGGMGRDITSIEHPGAITSVAFTGRLQRNIDKLRELRRVSAEAEASWSPYQQIAARSLSDYRRAADAMAASTVATRQRLVSLSAAGQPLVFLLASAIPGGSGRAITALASLGNIAAITTGKLRVLQAVSRAVPYALAAGGGYALGQWGAKKIFESETGMSWEGTSKEALAADQDKQRQLLEAGASRQRGVERQARDYSKQAEIEVLQLRLNGLRAGDREIADLREKILLKQRDVELSRLTNIEHQEAVRQLYAQRIEYMKMAEEEARENALASARRAAMAPAEEFDQRIKAMLGGLAERNLSPEERVRRPFVKAREEMNAMVKKLMSETFFLDPRVAGTEGRRDAVDKFFKDLATAEEEAIGTFTSRRDIMEQLTRRQQMLGKLKAPTGPSIIRAGVSGLEDFARSIQMAAASEKTDFEDKLLAYESRKEKLLQEIRDLQAQLSIVGE